MIRMGVTAASLAAVVTFATAAQGQDQRRAAPPQLERLLACRQIAGTAERLACFDRETASFETARARNDVVVVDRQQIRSTQRSLFGLTLPRIPFLDGDDESSRPAQEIDGVARTVRVNREGKWVVGLDDNAVWQTTDVAAYDTPPKPGAKVKIRRGSLGSFILAVEGKKALRAIRVR